MRNKKVPFLPKESKDNLNRKGNPMIDTQSKQDQFEDNHKTKQTGVKTEDNK